MSSEKDKTSTQLTWGEGLDATATTVFVGTGISVGGINPATAVLAVLLWQAVRNRQMTSMRIRALLLNKDEMHDFSAEINRLRRFRHPGWM